MARDEHLLHAEEVRPAAVRIYAWDPPTISLGYFQRFSAIARLSVELQQLAVVRRITGGGAILHDQEVTYCLALDGSVPFETQSPVALYRMVHECWQAALEGTFHSAAAGLGGQASAAGDRRHAWGTGLRLQLELAPEHFPMPTPRSGPFFCFEKPGRTDLLVDGVKLLGSAQRRIPGRVLQHGSLLLGRRFAAHPGADLGEPPPEVVAGWIDDFLKNLAAALELPIQPAEWTPDQLADVGYRRVRYASAAWTQRY